MLHFGIGYLGIRFFMYPNAQVLSNKKNLYQKDFCGKDDYYIDLLTLSTLVELNPKLNKK